MIKKLFYFDPKLCIEIVDRLLPLQCYSLSCYTFVLNLYFEYPR